MIFAAGVDQKMNDYIDKQTAINTLIKEANEYGACGYVDAFNIEKTLNAMPSVEVIRCKDCRFGYRFFDIINGVSDSWVECRNPNGLNRDVSEDSFCSYGERKDG